MGRKIAPWLGVEVWRLKTAMVVGYVKVGDMVEAKRLFDEMPQRNVASWNAMIWDFVKVGGFEQC
ncbi:hypothetical protein Ahy_A02g007708 [Arachis hypogaea]|uniref:Pentatricopeptide repeat-containing protein n=1 Tax=Arachis hypogaea TaxID=3818 RepID=A0A445ED58_ARAHY|nr:hypothetical protein Ahy_A02g007708 [Arachis hypogaea]